ncbi:MAG: hypothetical protein ACLSAH_02615 [Bilophila wadsworthia]
MAIIGIGLDLIELSAWSVRCIVSGSIFSTASWRTTNGAPFPAIPLPSARAVSLWPRVRRQEAAVKALVGFAEGIGPDVAGARCPPAPSSFCPERLGKRPTLGVKSCTSRSPIPGNAPPVILEDNLLTITENKDHSWNFANHHPPPCATKATSPSSATGR